MTSTSNNGFAAFLILRGNLQSAPLEKRGGKHRFYFSISQDEMDSMYLEYTKSEFPAYDAVGRTLRKELRKCTFL